MNLPTAKSAGAWAARAALWAFDRELKVGERVVFEDMIHYTMVKTTMFNGVHHPAIVIARRDGRTDVIREFGYEDFRNRMS